MNINETIQIGIGASVIIAGVLGGIGGGIYILRSRAYSLLKEEVKQLREDLNFCGEKHEDNEKRIVELEGWKEHYVSTPLKEIAEHIKKSNDHQQKTNEVLQSILTSCPKDNQKEVNNNVVLTK